jgi:hypothetical protein
LRKIRAQSAREENVITTSYPPGANSTILENIFLQKGGEKVAFLPQIPTAM